MNKYRVVTISSGSVREGAEVVTFRISGGIEIPAIMVGEEGRGRSRGVLPVKLTNVNFTAWKQGERVTVLCAEVGQSKSGKPKLFECETATNNDKVIVVFLTQIGFRGSNNHTGDRVEVYYELDGFYYRDAAEQAGLPSKDRYTQEEVEQYGLKIVAIKFQKPADGYSVDHAFKRRIVFADFPGEVLVDGTIAQGTAGRMGSGTQMVAILPAGVVFRTGYAGRLYGAPSAHYFVFDGTQVMAMTWDERQLADVFDEAIR